MSLLLDALKRAAQEKLEKQRQDDHGTQSASGEALSLDITDAPRSHQDTVQDSNDLKLEALPASGTDFRLHRADVLASELQAFMGRNTTELRLNRANEVADNALPREPAVASGAFAPAATPSPSPTPAAAARLFANKRASIIKSRQGMLIAGSMAALLLIAIFFIGYLSSLNRSNVMLERLQADVRPPANLDAPADSKKIEANLLAEQEAIGTLLDETPAPVEAEKTSAPEKTVTETAQTGSIFAKSRPEAVTPRTVTPRVTVQKSHQEALHDILLRAYSAYQSNDIAAAEAGYRQALARAPQNRDALLGFAATAIQRGDYAAAMESYIQLLELDPNDDLALAGISGLKQGVQGVAADEAVIKRLLLKRPESAQLHFALGNMYSAAADWPKAQSAYFDAHRFDAQNPDYAYNLAISLEHLQQAPAALRYYELALTLAGARKSNFDFAQVSARISILQPKNSATDAR